jgi:glutamate-1-semialdehyde 2,1-aminomutase
VTALSLPAATQRQAQLRARADQLFPGGVNSPVRAFRAVGGSPLILERGEGPFVWDADGNRYIDGIGSWGPAILGHGDARVKAAIAAALENGLALGATNPLEIELGERIRARMPSIERLRFTSSGTEAAMSAVRLARAATGRDLIVSFAGGYHGHSDGLLAEAGSGVATFAIPGSAGVPAAVAAETIVLPYNDPSAVTTAFAGHAGRIAAVLLEPVMANVGIVPPQPGFLESLRELTRADGALLIFDEVITGFRVGPGGAQARYGVRPDLTVLGKVIGGGMPVGAYGGRADLMRFVAPEGPMYQAGTLSGHPLAMAAGIATLDALEPDDYLRLEDGGARLEAQLTAALATSGVPGTVSRVGSLLTLFFLDHAPVDGADALTGDRQRFATFHGAMLRQGVLLPPSPFEAWFLSLAHTGAEIDAIAASAETAISEVAAA